MQVFFLSPLSHIALIFIWFGTLTTTSISAQLDMNWSWNRSSSIESSSICFIRSSVTSSALSVDRHREIILLITSPRLSRGNESNTERSAVVFFSKMSLTSAGGDGGALLIVRVCKRFLLILLKKYEWHPKNLQIVRIKYFYAHVTRQFCVSNYICETKIHGTLISRFDIIVNQCK